MSRGGRTVRPPLYFFLKNGDPGSDILRRTWRFLIFIFCRKKEKGVGMGVESGAAILAQKFFPTPVPTPFWGRLSAPWAPVVRTLVPAAIRKNTAVGQGVAPHSSDTQSVTKPALRPTPVRLWCGLDPDKTRNVHTPVPTPFVLPGRQAAVRANASF